MKRKILFTVSLLLLFCSGTAMAQMNIGYMSTNEVLKKLPKTEEIQQQINQLIQKKQTKLRKRATAFQDAVADYQTNKASMTSQEIARTEKNLRQLSRELSKFNQGIRSDIQRRRNELLLPVLEAIDTAIKKVAKAKSLDLVINNTTNAGANIIFYASDVEENITQEVLAKVKTIIE